MLQFHIVSRKANSLHIDRLSTIATLWLPANRRVSAKVCWTLDHRHLTICDALPNHAKEPIREVVAVETASVLRDGGHHDDDSGPEQDDGGAAARERTPPTPEEKESRRRFQNVVPLRPHSIAWNDLGLSDADLPERKIIVPTCAFLFYTPELPTKYPDGNNALHKHWLVQGSHEGCRLR